MGNQKNYGSLEEFLNTPVRDLDISVRLFNCLTEPQSSRSFSMRYGYLIVSDLLQFSPNDLMKLRNFGKTTLNELNSLLALYGLSLKKPSPSSQQIAKTEKQLQKLARMKKRLEPSERELAIKKLRSEGLTLAQIGERFSISTEYVRQLLLTCELKQEKRGTYSPDGYLGKQAKRLEESMKCELAETSAPSCAPSY